MCMALLVKSFPFAVTDFTLIWFWHIQLIGRFCFFLKFGKLNPSNYENAFPNLVRRRIHRF